MPGEVIRSTIHGAKSMLNRERSEVAQFLLPSPFAGAKLFCGFGGEILASLVVRKHRERLTKEQVFPVL